MVTDDNGKIFDDRRKSDRRQDERRKQTVKIEKERRSGADRRKGSRRD